jgi:ribokinase
MANQAPHICVVGSSNIDLTFRTSRLPRPGETMVGQSFHLGFGGKGGNQAVMAARLGARVSMVSKVGRDVFGEQAIANYRTEGIDITHLLVDEQRSTGVAGITVDDAARNCILIVPGANEALSPTDVRAAAGAIESAAVLLCQFEVPVETTWEALRIARAVGMRTILNPAPAVAFPDELLALGDLCVPNETEIEALTGLPATTLSQAEAAARALQRRGAATVLVTLGDRGVLLRSGESSEHMPALPVQAVDSSGAGDAFLGSLAVFLAEGRSLNEAVKRANAVAALSVTRLGTQTSFPRRAEVDLAQ